MRLALAPAGCGIAATLAIAAPDAQAKPFTWAFGGDVLTLDPHASNNTFTNAFLGNIYESLVRHDERLELEPALAERWETVSPTVWRFHLRPDVRFHGGEAFTAEDVVFSRERLNTPGALAKGNMANVAAVRALGPHTLEIETHRPFPILLNAPTQYVVVEGRVLMRDRAVLHLDEAAIVEATNRETAGRHARALRPRRHGGGGARLGPGAPLTVAPRPRNRRGGLR